MAIRCMKYGIFNWINIVFDSCNIYDFIQIYFNQNYRA